AVGPAPPGYPPAGAARLHGSALGSGQSAAPLLGALALDPQQGIVTPQGEQPDGLDQLAELAGAIVARVEFRHLLGDVTAHRPEIGPAIIPRGRIYGLAEQVAQLGILAQLLAAAARDGTLVPLGGRGAAVVALQEDLGIDEAITGGHQRARRLLFTEAVYHRSEERRVGKEGRSRGSPHNSKEKHK